MRQKFHVLVSGLLFFAMIFFLTASGSFGQNEGENIIPLDEGIAEEAIMPEQDRPPEDQGDKKPPEKMSLFQLIRKG